jgi:hypothetical protein
MTGDRVRGGAAPHGLAFEGASAPLVTGVEREQLLDRLVRRVLLGQPEAGADQHDRQDDRSVGRLANPALGPVVEAFIALAVSVMLRIS